MGLFLWQVSIYPVFGEGSKNGAMLSENIAKEETKKVDNVNKNLLENTSTGNIKIVVQRGENLWNLAQRYHTTVDEIVKLNQLKSPNQIREGEPLWVPNAIDVKDHPGEVVETASEAVDNLATVNMAWWGNILRSIPAFAAVYKLRITASRSSDPQPSQPEAKIETYEIIVNENTKSLDESTKGMSGDTVSGNNNHPQKQVAQKTVPLKTESQILSPNLGCFVSKEDVELLSRVIHGEARGENFEGQVAVGAVVLNRLKDPRFPKTIRAIIYQSGAFTAVEDRQIHLDPNDSAYKAAEAALSGVDPTNGAIFYFNPRIATDRWIKSRTVIKRIGNHTFSI